jgi:hypothetical protein
VGLSPVPTAQCKFNPICVPLEDLKDAVKPHDQHDR